jgi:predicted aspartyl protease
MVDSNARLLPLSFQGFKKTDSRGGLHWRILALVLGLLGGLLGILPLWAQPSSQSPKQIPAHFQANRIYVSPVTRGGDTLRLYTDTGGGKYPILTKQTADQLELVPIDTLSQGRRSMPLVPFPDIRGRMSFPTPKANRALVLPRGRQTRLMDIEDGMLGQSWFAGRVWTFDYGSEKLRHHPRSQGVSFDTKHTVDLTFQSDSTGRRTSHHPRIEATIADSTYSFLFDTGATSVLTDSARSALDRPKRIGSSFVIASVFERWQRRHPEWKVVERASVFTGGTPMIRVPEVGIAGHNVGPVWFERRPDRNFKRGMARSMDRPVEGALGGSLFQYFRVTVDYPEGRAYFERIK